MDKPKYFRDLLIAHLRDLYSAETQLIEALPVMEAAATLPDLKTAFHVHLKETLIQAERLEEFFRALGEKPLDRICAGMKGLIADAEFTAKEKYSPEVLDSGLIAAAQKFEHFEIAAYGTARAFALGLRDEPNAAMLHKTLKEEYYCDARLTQIAQSAVNNLACEQQDKLQYI